MVAVWNEPGEMDRSNGKDRPGSVTLFTGGAVVMKLVVWKVQ